MGICALSRLITAATPWKVSAGRLYCTAAALGISVLHWARHGDASTTPDVAALKIALNAEYGRGVVQGDVLPWRPSSD